MLNLLLLQLAAWNLGPFSRTDIINPILGPNPKAMFYCPMRKAAVHWEEDHVFNPAAVTRNGRVYVLFRAEDNSGSGIGNHTSRIGLAESDDGIHFSKRKEPILFPANDAEKAYEWPGGCEDPRIIEQPAGGYVLTYTAWDRNVARLSVATSSDLVHWKKVGLAFSRTKYGEGWSKSGAIVTRLAHDHLVAAKIGGKFWMYWGDGTIYGATSTDLLHWKPIYDSKGNLLAILTKRAGKFDSALVESGPPAIETKSGIVLIYNGENSGENGDKTLKAGVYTAGQALLDIKKPTRVLQRTDTCFMKPTDEKEISGQYKAGTVFTEGLALFKHKWFLYYGAADSYVGVTQALALPTKP